MVLFHKAQRVVACVQGTLDYAVQQLEGYRNELENRVVSRFDKAESRRDLADMAECARIMREFERQASGNGSLVQVCVIKDQSLPQPHHLETVLPEAPPISGPVRTYLSLACLQ